MSAITPNRSDFVRELNANTTVNGSNAFIDRIQLDIGDWALFGSSDQICDALSEFRNAEILSCEGEIVSLFKPRLVESIWNVRGLKFSTNPKSDAFNRASALISGSVELAGWRYRPTGKREGEQARINFLTQLNLTRFVQAQKLKRRTRLDRPQLASDYVMAISPDDAWYKDEIPLRPATNIIIGPNRKYAFALKDERPAQTRQYLNLVLEMLENVIDRAFNGSDAFATHLPYFSLKAIEFYWEFDTDTPIDYILSLRHTIMQHGDDVSDDIYEVENPSLRTVNQSPCLTVRLTKNIKIKAYAKTNRRVRFEVSLKNDAINSHAGPRAHDSIDGIVSLIPALAEEAATRLTPLLQSITAAPPPTGSYTGVQLIYRITQAAENPHVAETIIAALVALGRVAPYGQDKLLKTVQKLAKREVLRTIKPRSPIYVVTDQYRDALNSLRRYR